MAKAEFDSTKEAPGNLPTKKKGKKKPKGFKKGGMVSKGMGCANKGGNYHF